MISMKGRIEIIAGPMFSSKTAQLILRISQAQAVGQKAQVFKPIRDTRSVKDEVRSSAGLCIGATPVHEAREILGYLDPDTRIVALDEVQFSDDGVVDVCKLLASQGKRVIVAGLDMDFRGEPFGPMSHLLAIGEVVDKLTAICRICGEPAAFTQRLINGKPAKYTDPVILVGGCELYEPRCRSHHNVPYAEVGKHEIETR